MRHTKEAMTTRSGDARPGSNGSGNPVAASSSSSRLLPVSAKIEEILEAIEGVRTVVELLGPPSLGVMRLLSHWATQSGGLKVSEDELLAELRTVAADEWEQVLSEAERELHETMRKDRTEGRR
jgi:hypothetical protein